MVDRTLTWIERKPKDVMILSTVHMRALESDGTGDNQRCGRCGVVFGTDISTESIYNQIRTKGDIAIACDCGAYNLVTHQRLK